MPKVVITDTKGLVQSTGKGVEHKFAPTKIKLVADAADDTTVTVLSSGDNVLFGTATGLPGAGDGNNVTTLQLPTPTVAGERITIRPMNAAVIAKICGISVAEPASVTMTYVLSEAGAVVKTETTVAGVDGTANTMIKIGASHVKLGDVIECTALSTTQWLVEYQGAGGLFVGGDINVDPGNVAGHID